MPGLRELLGLPEPTPPPDSPAGSGRARLAKALRAIGDSLRAAAASAPESSLIPLRIRRSELVDVYQQSAPGSPEVKQALKDASSLAKDVVALAKTTRAAREQWESQAGKLEELEDRLADGDPGEAKQLRPMVEAAKAAADQRDFARAVALLSGDAKPAPAGDTPAVNEQRFPLSPSLARKPRVPTSDAGLAKWENPLINGDPRELFDPTTMNAVVDMHFEGEATPELNSAMEAIAFAQPGEDVSEPIKTLARMRGLSEEAALDQYKRFQQLQEVSNKVTEARGGERDEVFTSRREEYLQEHGEFLGTRSSLRFGQVVGQATGLDPAFAAMLNPTGGMVGPGMDVLAPTDGESPVIYHGIFHDAGGYLLTHQNAGPGYTYWDGGPREGEAPGADPLHGQVEGISRWYEIRGDNRSFFEDVYEPGFTAEVPEDRELAYDRFVRHPIDDAEAWVDDLSEDALGAVSQGAKTVAKESAEAVDSLQATTRAAADQAEQAIQSATAAVDAAAQAARDAGLPAKAVAAAQKATKSGLQQAGQGIAAVEAGVVGGLETAGDAMSEAFNGMAEWADSLHNAIDQKTDELADAAEQAVHDKLVEIASDPDVQKDLTDAVDKVVEIKQSAADLMEAVDEAIGKAGAAAEKIIDAAGDAGQTLLEGLGDVREKAEQLAADAAAGLSSLAQGAALAGQDLMDTLSGVGDSLLDVVDSGVDTFSNTATSATEEAAKSLNQQTSLLD